MDNNIKNDMENLDENSIKEKNEKNLFIKICIFFSISLILLIVTLFNIKRVVIFSTIFGSLLGNIKHLGIILYLISLVVIFIYYSVLFVFYFILKYYKKIDWYKELSYYDKKFDIISFIFKCFSILLFLLIFLLTPCVVAGNSMNDTLQTGDTLLCSNLFYTPKKDDIVIFDSHDYVSKDSENHAFYIKRVVATEGDVIRFDSEKDTIYINDDIVNKEDFLGYYDSYTQYENIRDSINNVLGITNTNDEVTIPNGYLVVFGDNRKNSFDSRSFGVISKNSIFGKAIFRIFPFTKISIL